MAQSMQVMYVRVTDITPSDFNPPSRVNVASLTQLEQEIKDCGEILVPLALTKNGQLADGHRRLTIAKRLGIVVVPCIYYDTDNAKALWARLNSGTKAVDSKTWVEAYNHGLDIAYFPPRQKSDMIGLQHILSKDEFAMFCSKRRSPGILQSAYHIGRLCGDLSDSFVREILLWIMHTEQLPILKHAMADGLATDQVIEIILSRRRMHRWG